MERKFSISEAIILLGRISLIEEDINKLISQCAGSEYENVNAVWDILVRLRKIQEEINDRE